MAGYKYYQNTAVLDLDSSLSMLIDTFVCIMSSGPVIRIITAYQQLK